MTNISYSDASLIVEKIRQFKLDFKDKFIKTISNTLGQSQYIPPELQSIFDEMDTLDTFLTEKIKAMTNSLLEFDISENDASLIRAAIIHLRLQEARNAEELLVKTFHDELLDHIWSPIQKYESIMNKEWFGTAESRKLPMLSEFFPIEYLQTEINNDKVRIYDEKFHILQAPRLFRSDLDNFRSSAEVRDLSFAIAFVDIDNFKQFNTDLTETVVDRNVLPTVMRCMESHLYKRGYAYRQGGDEYMLLIFNSSKEESIRFVSELREKISKLAFRNIPKKNLTVSIGLVHVTAECYFTNRELEEKSSEAKAFAKDNGRNCVASYQTNLLDQSELYIYKHG